MAIESIYPVVISAYSLTVTALAVVLWWKTQTRIDRTKKSIETQVANAVTDIKGQVESKLGALDIAAVGKQVETLTANFTELADNIPEFDQEALMARLDALETGLPDMIGTHISMAIKGVQATEAKQIGAYVESLGIEGLTEEMKEAAIAKLTLTQRMAHELLTMKVPPKVKRARPLSTMVFEQSRGLVAQAILEREGGNVTIEGGPARSGSFRPGYNP
jgi:hypothetical protein